MNLLTISVCVVLWGYGLRLLTRSGLRSFRFLLGCAGLFFFLTWTFSTYLALACAKCTYTLAGAFGALSRTFSFHITYEMLYIPVQSGAVTFPMSLEYSGAAELASYLVLLAFFPVYRRMERLVLALAGGAYIMAASVLRLILMAEVVHFWGTGAYVPARFFIGPVLSCVCNISLYYLVFTKGQVARIAVGDFSYRLDRTEGERNAVL